MNDHILVDTVAIKVDLEIRLIELKLFRRFITIKELSVHLLNVAVVLLV